MTSNTLPNADKKYLFDMHFFDDDLVEEEIIEEEAPPPPPTFSEEELAAAKKKGFEEGKAAGLKESAESRAQEISKLIEKILQKTETLFTAESEREKNYEHEAVSLSLHVFEKLFPSYSQHVGFAELKTSIETVLKKHEGQKEITINVHPDVQSDIQSEIEKLLKDRPNLRISVTGNADLAPADCNLSWKDGGYVKETQKIAEEIRTILDTMLEEVGAKGHDKEAQTDDGASKEDISKEDNTGAVETPENPAPTPEDNKAPQDNITEERETPDHE